MSDDRYAEAGVDYSVLDAAKRSALTEARATVESPTTRGARVNEGSFGEPATIVRVGEETLGFVLECLGTKSIIAAEYQSETGVDRFGAIGYDTVAASVNDCAATGALPIVVNAYFAVGSSSFYFGTRFTSLVGGFRRGCEDAGAAWGGGESPSLTGLVAEEGIDLAASVLGRVPHGRQPLLGEELRAGDEIVLVASSGLHQNGASLARSVATSAGHRWATALPSGRDFGDAVLDPGIIYVALIERLLAAELPLHYVSHLTGHGFRKLMRANREFTYRINDLPEVPEVLDFIVERAGLTRAEAYGTLNMGAGLACFVSAGHADLLITIAEGLGLRAMVAGTVEEGRRSVVIEPFGIEYQASSLEIR